ncbi:carbohydrate sulfotransferase 3-like [Haliotis asinina]|uniref:carbohydrate sulfotransferase 3-like n=1 Tax=Haliotis asinina TaxID=109174 RepID=UPI003531C894
MECRCSPLRIFLLFTGAGFVLTTLYSLNAEDLAIHTQILSHMVTKIPGTLDTVSEQAPDEMKMREMLHVGSARSPSADVNKGRLPINEDNVIEDNDLRTSKDFPPLKASSRTNLLIVTYMRSGSSLTGNMFEMDPSVFYVFEPLHDLKWYKWGENINIQYLMSRSNIMRESIYTKVAGKTIRRIFRCDFPKLDIATLTQYHMQSSPHTKSYHTCLQRYPGVLNILKCMPILYNRCKAAKVGVIKTIEFPITAAKDLATKDRTLKVLHLIRDPRATLLSQVSHGRFSWDAIEEESSKYCKKVLEDVQVTRQWYMESQTRIKILFYEDLCQNPSSEVEELYKFVGLNYTEDTEIGIKKLTSAASDRTCVICTQRKSSKKAAERWRGKIRIEYVRIIDRNCMKLYRYVGYLPVENLDVLRNVSHPLRIITHV